MYSGDRHLEPYGSRLRLQPHSRGFQFYSSISLPMNENKTQLRRRLRAERRALSAYQQRLHGRAAITLLGRIPQMKRAGHIGIYWPMDGELDVRSLLRRFPEKQFYLPVLPEEPHPHLGFKYWNGAPLPFRNRFHIPEPVRSPSRAAGLLDLVLVPLVAFDPTGARLGMGAGFYDRTFEHKQLLPGSGPQLIGVAHQLQCVQHLPTDNWDIPLDTVVTEQRIYRCR